ncbi:MAG: WYL domain-containing protein [Deinococcales bacterium]|nr:WYL domain-containing protein [Deinococcales bacterium]
MSRTVAKAQRLNLLREELRLRPRTVVELARRHETSRRTIERDLATLAEQMGEELRKDTSHRWYIPNRTPGLNEVEALAVYSATRLLLHTGVGERHYRTALEKLAQQVPEPARATLLRSVDRLEPAPEDRVLDLVAQAWFQQRVLKVDYASAHSGTKSARELEVYFFELNRRNLEPYVLAFDRTVRRRVLVFKLARMSNVRLLDRGYEIPADFDPMAALDPAFGIVVGEEVQVDLLVPEQVAQRMAEGDDRNLRLGAQLDDGRRLVHLLGTLDSGGRPLELVPWLLSWGSAVEVVGPPEVRELMREELARALDAYRG